ncbi:sarcosine oxidase subunit delta [Curvibacter sp. CHRR-16]|uniref:sarcosine oxidase subunit delta n=1 Tax=Curvibacter sp. CHRR-16 TaxID=2835872 RepID=UPI001BD998E6|nr:sarcosine oxidase subunit delta [Curvibacter sp. CHRR-16]MBT0570716.1 sarcosine oxidase subunit delta [Curvibacter sp. CHRR-16]
MLQLHCPHCAALRDEEEFSYAGPAYLVRPVNPEGVNDEVWGDYLFKRANTKGWYWEQWQHSAGCRKVLVVKRNTASYAIAGTWTLADGKAVYEADPDAQAQRLAQLALHNTGVSA